MKEKIKKKIRLFPKDPKDNTECRCSTCGGIGFMIEDGKWLVQCNDCINGIVPKCEYCGEPMKLTNYSFKCVNTKCNWKEEKEIECENEAKLKEVKRRDNSVHYSLDNCPKESCEMYFSESYGYNNGYFYEIDELELYCEECNIEMPKYIWGTTREYFSLDAADFVESSLEESYEDAWDNVDQEELKCLQEACDKFIAAHYGCLDTYYVDYKVCIDL